MTEREVRFRQVFLQSQGHVGFGARARLPTVKRFKIVENRRAGGSEPGVGQRKLRVERDRVEVKLLRFLVILEQGIGITFNLVRTQIQDIGVRVVGGFFLDPRFLLGI